MIAVPVLGTYVQLSAEGMVKRRAHTPPIKQRRGIVVGFARNYANSVQVLWDSRAEPQTIHVRFIDHAN